MRIKDNDFNSSEFEEIRNRDIPLINAVEFGKKIYYIYMSTIKLYKRRI